MNAEWSSGTFGHVEAAAEALQRRVEALRGILRAGPALASPQLVHDVLQGVDEAMQGCWAPVIWDAALEEQRD